MAGWCCFLEGYSRNLKVNTRDILYKYAHPELWPERYAPRKVICILCCCLQVFWRFLRWRGELWHCSASGASYSWPWTARGSSMDLWVHELIYGRFPPVDFLISAWWHIALCWSCKPLLPLLALLLAPTHTPPPPDLLLGALLSLLVPHRVFIVGRMKPGTVAHYITHSMHSILSIASQHMHLLSLPG